MIFNYEDLEQFCETMIIDQFKEEGRVDQDQEELNSNIHKIAGILEIACTEIICCKASMQLRKITPEKQLSKFKIITQIPNFRLGLIVKIIHMMNVDMKSLIEHVNAFKKSGDDKIKLFKGQTKIWDLPRAQEPVKLSPSQAISFFVKYIYDL